MLKTTWTRRATLALAVAALSACATEQSRTIDVPRPERVGADDRSGIFLPGLAGAPASPRSARTARAW